MFFQHDGAPPHYIRHVRDYLNQSFSNRWLGRGGPVAWPPRSPDLMPLDYYLWEPWDPNDNYDMSASVFIVQFNGFMSLTS